MIAFLNGRLAAVTQDTAYIDVNGVGYAVGMSGQALSRLPEKGSQVSIFTYLQVRDDGVSLYGFLTQAEKEFFLRLISVSGVGPKVALAALSVFTPSELASAIAAQDASMVARIPGVGKKTASRIILELKGNVEDVVPGQTSVFESHSAEHMAGAREALLSMGFTSAEADLALKDAPEQASESVLLQYALKRLGE